MTRAEEQHLIDRNSRLVALVTTLVTLVFAVMLMAELFDTEVRAGFQFVQESVTWLESAGWAIEAGRGRYFRSDSSC